MGRGPATHPRGQDRGPLQHIPASPRHGAMPRLSPWMAASPVRGAAPRGAASRSIPRDRHGQGQGRKAGSATSPSESGFAAACFLLLPRRLRKSFCLHLSCKNRKNPTVLAGTSPASESIFPASAGNKTINESLQQCRGEARRARHGMQGPEHITALCLGSLPACTATSTGRAGNALLESASRLPAAHPCSDVPQRLLSRSRDPITAPEMGQGQLLPPDAMRVVPSRAGGSREEPLNHSALQWGFFCKTLLSNQHSAKARSGQTLFQLERETKNAKGRFTRQYD